MIGRIFKRKQLKLKPLCERQHNLNVSGISNLSAVKFSVDKRWKLISQRVVRAKETGSSIIWICGAHVIRSGVQRYIIDLMQRGYISGLAMNGAGMIHDFEFALIGATTESVARYVKVGQFGLWKETGKLNDIINKTYRNKSNFGLGETVGKEIATGNFPYRETSILAMGYKLKIPITVHVSMGCDIIHELPNCNGAATGALSYTDFLKFVALVQQLEKGILFNFGSAVMGPEIYLKALSMARNVAKQKGNQIQRFYTVVCDLYNIPADYCKEPVKDTPGYYFRPWKTILVRTVAEGGKSFYFRGNHSETIPALWQAINSVQ